MTTETLAAVRDRFEVHEDGTPLYLHAVDCPSYCDYACNGNQREDLVQVVAALLAEVARLTAVTEEPTAHLAEAANLCFSEANRWRAADARTADHWERVATLLRGRQLAIAGMLREIGLQRAAIEVWKAGKATRPA